MRNLINCTLRPRHYINEMSKYESGTTCSMHGEFINIYIKPKDLEWKRPTGRPLRRWNNIK